MESLALLIENVLVVFYVLRKLFGGKKRKKSKHATVPKPQWVTVVRSATQYESDWHHEVGYKPKVIPGVMAVRVMRGKETHTIGTVGVSEPDFDAQIAVLTARADERATSLNALADEYAS